MTSNNSNHSDGSFHVYLDEVPRWDGKILKKKKAKVETKEVKNDKKKARN